MQAGARAEGRLVQEALHTDSISCRQQLSVVLIRGATYL